MLDKIAVINQSSGYLMRDIAEALSERYDDVVLLASYPLAGIKTDKIAAYDKQSGFRRLWSWLVATVQIWWKVTRRYHDDVLLIVSNPPFATLLPLLFRNRFSLLVFDVYPDIFVSQHIAGNSNPIVRWWRRTNKKIYAKAEHVYTISNGMKQCLCQYTDEERIEVVPLWPDKGNILRIAKEDNPFVSNQHLEGKFVVLYSGNLGNTHRMDVLVDVAMRMKDEDVEFLIVGEGGKKGLIQEKIEQSECCHVRLLPRQPYNQLSPMLNAADIAVVTLDMHASQLSVPSKTFNLMAVGAPLMCIASPSSEIGNMVAKYRMGKVFSPDDIEGMAGFVRDLKEQPALREEYSRNSFAASQYFTSENAKLLM